MLSGRRSVTWQAGLHTEQSKGSKAEMGALWSRVEEEAPSREGLISVEEGQETALCKGQWSTRGLRVGTIGKHGRGWRAR